MKKAGIIGSGPVAKSLANGLMKEGWKVMMGSRDISKLNSVTGIEKGSMQDAAEFGDLIILAVKGNVAIEALKGCNISGKTVIDTCNPIADAPPVNGVLQYFTAANSSLMEMLQKEYPQAHFVKAFNSVGNALMYQPKFSEGIPTMFIGGNDSKAKQETTELLTSFGWQTMDMGGVESARAIEALCMLWCIPGFASNQWSHAFKMLMK